MLDVRRRVTLHRPRSLDGARRFCRSASPIMLDGVSRVLLGLSKTIARYGRADLLPLDELSDLGGRPGEVLDDLSAHLSAVHRSLRPQPSSHWSRRHWSLHITDVSGKRWHEQAPGVPVFANRARATAAASHCVDVDRTRSARQRDSWQVGNDRKAVAAYRRRGRVNSVEGSRSRRRPRGRTRPPCPDSGLRYRSGSAGPSRRGHCRCRRRRRPRRVRGPVRRSRPRRSGRRPDERG